MKYATLDATLIPMFTTHARFLQDYNRPANTGEQGVGLEIDEVSAEFVRGGGVTIDFNGWSSNGTCHGEITWNLPVYDLPLDLHLYYPNLMSSQDSSAVQSGVIPLRTFRVGFSYNVAAKVEDAHLVRIFVPQRESMPFDGYLNVVAGWLHRDESLIAARLKQVRDTPAERYQSMREAAYTELATSPRPTPMPLSESQQHAYLVGPGLIDGLLAAIVICGLVGWGARSIRSQRRAGRRIDL